MKLITLEEFRKLPLAEMLNGEYFVDLRLPTEPISAEKLVARKIRAEDIDMGKIVFTWPSKD
jgi:hypothetical protein